MTETDSEFESEYFSDEVSTFGDRLTAARHAAQLTQEALSRNMGIKLKTLKSWENDLSEPRSNKLQMLAGVLNVSLVWLMIGEGEGVAAPDDEADNAAKSQNRILARIIKEMHSVCAEHAAIGSRLAKLEKELQMSLAQ